MDFTLLLMVCGRQCVCDATGLRVSHPRDAEAGRGKADRDGHSWVQRHGWGGGGVRNGPDKRLGTGARERRDGKRVGFLACLGQGQARRVMYMYAT